MRYRRNFVLCKFVAQSSSGPGRRRRFIIFTNQGIFAIPEQPYQPFPFLVKPLILLESPPPRTNLPPHLFEKPCRTYLPCVVAGGASFKAFVRKLQANSRVFDLLHAHELDTLLVLTAEDSICHEKPKVVALSKAASATSYNPLPTLAAESERDEDYPMHIAAPAAVPQPSSSAFPSTAASPTEAPASFSNEEVARILQAAPAPAVASLAHHPSHVQIH
ncbi:hypothetical protein Rt10032_c08g3587 [Rhodotorula toruloides]|uniref:Uncharacterized protein n=1 Tax=Rhodotorula toruloides TaxID=5286 RepID=A0A511KGS5_RHOTO|nr:hypothetical protein Rt10032_c08g3587 [Rhodotorula toruloides]